jgi:hypothetical protein
MDDLSAAAVDIDRALYNRKEKESLQYTRFSDSAEGEPARRYRGLKRRRESKGCHPSSDSYVRLSLACTSHCNADRESDRKDVV